MLHFVVSAFVFVDLFLPSLAFIPAHCTVNTTIFPAICCPKPTGFVNPCGYPSRGVCQRVSVHRQDDLIKQKFSLLKADLRLNWPERIFQFVCHCKRPFHGVDCGRCWYGRTGTNCQHKVTFIRRNYLNYTRIEKQQFQQVLLRAYKTPHPNILLPIHKYGDYEHFPTSFKTTTIQEGTSFKHWFSTYPFLTKNSTLCSVYDGVKRGWDYCHGRPGFLTFHRLFMLDWETHTRTVAENHFGIKNFTFPYWDWTDKKECEVCTNDMLGETGSDENGHLVSTSPFSNWSEHCDAKSASSPLSCQPCFGTTPRRIRRLWLTKHFPKSSDIRTVLKLRHFMGPIGHTNPCHKFSYVLENAMGCSCRDVMMLHAKVHFMISGTMIVQSTNSDDPFFIVHHTQIDRLLSRWFRTHKPSKLDYPNVYDNQHPGHCRDCGVVGFLPVVKHGELFVDTKELGYDYDNFDFGQVKESEKVVPIPDAKLPNKLQCENTKGRKLYALQFEYLKKEMLAAGIKAKKHVK